MSPVRAWLLGLADVLRAPLMVAGIAIIMIAITVPFAAVLQTRLQESLSVQPQISLDDTEIDPEWWMEFRAHVTGLASTFTPAVLGFAATLDGLSGVLDGRGIPLPILGPLLVSVIAWAFIWGGVLHRYHQGTRIGIRGFFKAGFAHLPRFVALAAVAALLNLLLYLTLHKLLFGPVHEWLVSMTTTERDAFLVRAGLYVLFFIPVVGVSLVADYARVDAVAAGTTSPAQMLRRSVEFISRRVPAVLALYLLTGLVFVMITVSYGTLEIYGGSQVGGWRAVAIGQAYVLVRLGLRLLFAASELRLFKANQTATAL